jgi:hypothetical protein
MSILHSSKKSETISAESTEIQTIDGQQFEVKVVAEFEVTSPGDVEVLDDEFTEDDHPLVLSDDDTGDDFDEDDEDA